jgi:hypothetical protein
MHQVIPENIAEILFKRLFVFICLFIAAMIIVHLHQSFTPYPSFNTGEELNKTDIVFSAFN